MVWLLYDLISNSPTHLEVLWLDLIPNKDIAPLDFTTLQNYKTCHVGGVAMVNLMGHQLFYWLT